MEISRRAALRSAAAAGLLAAPGLRFGFAASPQASSSRVLVFLMMRGAMDGLNLVAPSDDADLFAARPEGLRLLSSGTNPALPLANGPSSNDWRLHPKATGLKTLYDAGQLAFVHAAGVPADSRSHFQMQSFVENGVADAITLSHSTSGWIARLGLANGYGGKPFALVSADATLPPSMSGDNSAVSMPDPAQFTVGSAARSAFLNAAYATAPGTIGASGKTALSAVAGFKTLSAGYTPPPAGTYGTDSLSKAFSVISEVIKLNAGLQLAEVEYSDWDTHVNQQPRFANSVTNLNAGLSSFLKDMTASGKAVTVVAMSEFGRRVKSNASGGTDHGHGNVMIVAGSGVKGGRIYGKWLGLSSSVLDQGDVPVTTDYRQVISDVVAATQGANATLFPGFTPSTPVGLF
jgi:uncharacterized protein (DUF1501 family)